MIQTVVLCGVVIVIAQYVDMAAKDFDLTFISTSLVNFITISLIALILMRKLFQLANRLEKAQIKKAVTPLRHVLLPACLKQRYLSLWYCCLASILDEPFWFDGVWRDWRYCYRYGR